MFCIDVQPISETEKPLVASGGEDDICYIWNLETGQVKQKLNNFKDSVTHVKFNQDGSYLAVADMSGNIMVLKVLPNLVQNRSRSKKSIFHIKGPPKKLYVLL